MSWAIEGFGLRGPCLIQGGSSLKELLNNFQPRGRVLAVVEERVALLHGEKLPGHCPRLILPSQGEGLKQPCWLNYLLEFFSARNLTRTDWVLAVGGGALTDLVGFAASVYKRGINTALAPTTLLAQVDAAVGGKCAINWRGVKNLLGNFYYPVRVFAGADVLTTLPRREYYAGLAEVYKYQLLQAGADYFQVQALNRVDIIRAVEASCRYKDSIVARDPFDTGERRILNLGHTLAHALEALDPGMLHGEAVAWGLEYALRTASRRGYISSAELRHVLAVLGSLPRRRLPHLDFAQVYRKMIQDKKNSSGQIRMVLPGPEGIYQLYTCPGRELEDSWDELVNNS